MATAALGAAFLALKGLEYSAHFHEGTAPRAGDPHREEKGGGRYVVALAALLALTGVSFALSGLPLGAAGPALALVIAGIKVLIVGFVFMHLGESTFATRLVGLVTVLSIAFLCLGVIADVGYR